MNNHTHPAPILALSLLLAAAAGSAFAQDALGDGRALDANPGQYGAGNYQRPSLMDELRFRNSIATGNAPGGLSFRGDVGYRAPGEFSGELGSDSLFAFRRDSLYSGLAGMGIRGTDALQYQFALTTGAAPPRNLMGNLSYTRDDAYSSSSSYRYNPNTGSQPQSSLPGSPISIDQTANDLDTRGRQLSAPSQVLSGYDSGALLGTLRSSSTYTSTSTLQPSLMSVYSEGLERKPMGLVSSPLLGVTTTPLVDPNKPANPLVARPTNADTDPTVPGDLSSTRVNTAANGARESTRVTTSYDQLVDEMRQQVQTLRDAKAADDSMSINPGESNDAWLIRQMEDLRQKLYGNKPANDRAQNDPNQSTDPAANEQDDPGMNPGTDRANPTDPAGATGSPSGSRGTQDQNTGQNTGQDATAAPTLPPLVSAPGQIDSPAQKQIEESTKALSAGPDNSTGGVQLYDPTDIAIDPDTLEVLRGGATKQVEQLISPAVSDGDLYVQHLSVGQKLIQEGRYFDAEERFTYALSLKPGDVPSQLGRLHAQIGAGMLLSASVNIQSLFSAHPELITSKYSSKLLPTPERIDSLKTRLRERAGLINYEQSPRAPEGERIQVAAGMLLAYLGYQTDDTNAVGQGLSVLRAQGSPSDRRFASLLSQLWDVPAEKKSNAAEKGSSPQE